MEPIATLFKPVPKTHKGTERGELITYFRETINRGRKGTKYKSLSMRFVAVKLGGVPTKDLYALVSKMKDAEHRGVSTSMVFFSELKVKELPHGTVTR